MKTRDRHVVKKGVAVGVRIRKKEERRRGEGGEGKKNTKSEK